MVKGSVGVGGSIDKWGRPVGTGREDVEMRGWFEDLSDECWGVLRWCADRLCEQFPESDDVHRRRHFVLMRAYLDTKERRGGRGVAVSDVLSAYHEHSQRLAYELSDEPAKRLKKTLDVLGDFHAAWEGKPLKR